MLKITGTKGLASPDTRVLTKLLNNSSAEHARNKAVAGFSLTDTCQEFLLTKNTPDAAKHDRTVKSRQSSFQQQKFRLVLQAEFDLLIVIAG